MSEDKNKQENEQKPTKDDCCGHCNGEGHSDKVVSEDKSDNNSSKRETVTKRTDNSDSAGDDTELERKKSSKAFIWALLFIAVLTAIGIFATRISINKDVVAKQVAHVKDVISKQAKKSGGDFDFQYEDMAIEGSLFSKKIVVKKPYVSIKKPNGKTYDIYSETADILLDSYDATRFRIIFPPVISVNKSGVSSTLEASSPLVVKLFNNEKEKELAYNFPLPSEIQVTKHGEDVPRLVIKSKKGAKQGILDTETGKHHSEFILKDATIIYKGHEVEIASLEGALDSESDDGTTTVDHKVVAEGVLPADPYNLFGKLDINIKARCEKATVTEDYGLPSEVDINIEEFVVKNGLSEVKLTGQFQKLEDELIPLGNGKLEIKGLNSINSALIDSGKVDERTVGIFNDIVKRVAAKDENNNESGKPVTIELQREYGGGFYIGDITFEELFAYALREYFSVPAPVRMDAPPAIKGIDDVSSDDSVSNSGDTATGSTAEEGGEEAEEDSSLFEIKPDRKTDIDDVVGDKEDVVKEIQEDIVTPSGKSDEETTSDIVEKIKRDALRFFKSDDDEQAKEDGSGDSDDNTNIGGGAEENAAETTTPEDDVTDGATGSSSDDNSNKEGSQESAVEKETPASTTATDKPKVEEKIEEEVKEELEKTGVTVPEKDKAAADNTADGSDTSNDSEAADEPIAKSESDAVESEATAATTATDSGSDDNGDAAADKKTTE